MKNVELLPVVSALGMLGFVSSADAFSIVNRDAQPHVLKVIEGDEQREVRIEPYGRAGSLCSSFCDVSVDDGPGLYGVAASDTLSIKDGELLSAEEETEEQMIDDPPEEPPEEPT